MGAQIEAGMLAVDGVPLFEAVGDGVAVAADPSGTGVFLQLAAERPGQLLRWTLGAIQDLDRFTCCHRYEPYWMMPTAGHATAQLPGETQWLLVRRGDGRYLLVVPLVDEDLRFSLEASGQHLVLVGQSDDAFHVGSGGTGAFLALGDCPYALQERGAAAVAAQIGSRLRRDKPLPRFIDHFGWCTWDAFYGDVSHARVREGLESFRAIGIEPRLLILDDGWQQVAAQPTGERRLVGLGANEKFGGDLAPTVTMAKQDFAVEQFLVWHAVVGYWGGVDGQALPRYRVQETAKNFGVGIRRHRIDVDQWLGGPVVGLVPAETIGAFYHDYHRGLRAMGVDGVKVDNQGVLEGLAQGQGGRVALNRAYREALDGSVQVHFGGTLINCMSNANETWYFAAASNCIRSSTDFWPNKPETHGLHQYTNAQVCMWFSEFIHPDWDMFQSGHAMGAYHAAARALSGGPVYVSDKPGSHDPALLRKLVLHDGSVPRCDDVGRPTLDCLFHDPTAEAVPLKIFNRVGAAGLVGLFHARYQLRSPLQATVSPEDVPGLTGERFACYLHCSKRMSLLEPGSICELELAEADWELATLVPVVDGLAVIGLGDRLVAPATVHSVQRQADGVIMIAVVDAGELVLWCERRPAAVTVDGAAASAQFDSTSRCLVVAVEGAGPHHVQLEP
jgi:raffinose synthase